ncbi:uncharacterized protein LOC117641772 [Thrips palmi]|uniref:non-specific serine/threonine protein kinase n=1 Tax=Thrips palmi TaxID=161013 RepID=A0A6P8ZJF8_THRPL|nr:uncharacterized protein LOC117641772 [Thrips palmi]
MPPVLNTYGVKKKKRGRLPKFLFEEDAENDDVFESLNIENIKETKALLVEKRRPKLKKKETVKKPFYSLGLSDDADSTFDRLLKEGPTQSLPSPPKFSDSSTSSNDSDEFEFRRLSPKKTLGKKQTNRNFKSVVKTRKVSEGRGRKKLKKSVEDSFFTKDEEGAVKLRKEAKGEDSFFTMRNVIQNAGRQHKNVCKESYETTTPMLSKRTKKQLEALSPILPINLTSTPVGNMIGKHFESPLSCRLSPGDAAFMLNESASVRSAANVSVDMFASCELEENQNLIAPDKASSEDHPSSPEQSMANILPVSNSSLANHVECGVNLSGNCSMSSVNGCQDSECKKPTDTQICVASDEFGDGAHECGMSCEQATASASNISRSFQDFPEKCGNLSGNSALSPGEDSKCNRSVSKQIDTPSLIVVDENDGISHVDITGYADSDMSGHDAIVDDVKTSSLRREICSEEGEEIVSSNTSDPSIKDCVVMLSRCDLTGQPVLCVDTSPMDSSNSHNRTEDFNISQNISCQNDVISSCHQASPNIIPLKQCEVLLHRCDAEQFVGTPFSVETMDSSSCPVLVPHKTNDVCNYKSEIDPRVPFDCKITLTRCDNVEKDNSEFSSTAICSPSGSLIPEANCESFVGLSCARPDERRSTTPEPVVLKPGKHWRRSLSILTKFRNSLDEPSSRKSLEGKSKGKLWESSVNSLMQLQPNREEVILEDFEGSVSSCHTNESQRKDFTHSDEDDSVIICEASSRTDNVTSYEVLSRCGQEEPLPFLDCYPSSMKEQCQKIGEGVYGEVFLYSGNPVSVIKIIPIEGKMEVNGEPQKTFKEIFSEVCIAQELSDLRKGTCNATWTFNEVQAIRCVQGSYPAWLQDLWHSYNDTKGSENDCPDMFQEDQLFIVLELRHGGKDLESFVFSSADQGLAAFKQIALTVAVGENALNFEHRDLHWGNVLLASTKTKAVDFVLNGEARSVLSKGVEVSIIDFTLSRINNPDTRSAVYYDLSQDETLFTAQGDYQFDIYRMMKDYCGNKWDGFTPKTNIAWLHYLLDKFCTMVRYKNRTSKVHTSALDTLNEMKDTVLMFSDVVSFVNCPLFCNK